MRNFTLITVFLLCSLSRTSLSVSESHTVRVQPGEDATLLCSNYTSSPIQKITWFKLVNRTQPHCISHISKSVSFCDGFKSGKFETTSNLDTVFLKIKQVDLSDSGLYFCGYTVTRDTAMVSTTYLEVQDVFDGTAKLMSIILIPGSLTVFLVLVVICLAVKIKKLQKAPVEEQNPQESHGSEELNYAAVTFRAKTNRNHRPASEGQEQPIYSSTRKAQKPPADQGGTDPLSSIP